MTSLSQMAGGMSDQDIMPRYRMTPPVRGRCPSLRNAERNNSRYSKQTNLVDLVVKTRGLWWGCGEATTRSYAKPVNTLGPTLWGCGQKQVEAFFKTDLIFFLLEISISCSRRWLQMNQSQRQPLKITAARFREWLQALNYSPKTRVNYTRDVKVFLEWLADNTTINSLVDVTPAHLLQYQIALYNFERSDDNGNEATKEKEAKRLSVGTQAARLAAVRKFFAWLLSEQQIAYNPATTLQLPKQPQRLPRGVLTKSEPPRLTVEPPTPTPGAL